MASISLVMIWERKRPAAGTVSRHRREDFLLHRHQDFLVSMAMTGILLQVRVYWVLTLYGVSLGNVLIQDVHLSPNQMKGIYDKTSNIWLCII